jgi:hypothetical protein
MLAQKEFTFSKVWENYIYTNEDEISTTAISL